MPAANSVPVQVHRHGGRCRDAAIVSMQMLIEQVKAKAQDGMISVDEVSHIGHALMRSDGSLMGLYHKHSSDCVALFERLKNEKPIDYLARVLLEPFTPLMSEKGNKIPPKALPRILAAFQQLLGPERYGVYGRRLSNRANAMKGTAVAVQWPAYFQDRAVMSALLSCQVAIARSFDKFGNRMQWFITMVNRDPTPAPGTPAAADAEGGGDDGKLEVTFQKDDFIRIMYAFFANVRLENFDEAAKDAFFDKYEAFPDAVFGPIFANLLKAQENGYFVGDESEAAPAVREAEPVVSREEVDKAPEGKKKKSLLGMFG